MNCPTCGEKLVRVPSGYACAFGHGRIIDAAVVERAEAIEKQREKIIAIEARRKKRLENYPIATRIKEFECFAREPYAIYSVAGNKGYWGRANIGYGLQVDVDGKLTWLIRNDKLEAVILRLAKEIEG